MPCKYYTDDGDTREPGCNCTLKSFNVSLGVCRNCKDNTAAPEWPMPCTDCTPKPGTEIIRPVPHANWPAYAKVISGLRNKTDTGVGDTAARVLAIIGMKTLADVYAAITGHDCGCLDRQGRLNSLYPYAESRNAA